MAKATVLVIEDDPEIRELLAFTLGKEGWTALVAADGEEGLRILGSARPDCVVLDIMLPGMDGLEALRRIRAGTFASSSGGSAAGPGTEAARAYLPVIMTTAKGEDSDIVAGLELGADDYVVKPYSPRVLVARIRAALRRKALAEALACGEEGALVHGGLALDPSRHAASWRGARLELTATEFAMLEFLMRRPGRVFSRSQIIEAVKGPDYPVTDRSVDVQVLQLRKKLGEGGALVETVRGVGYRVRDLP